MNQLIKAIEWASLTMGALLLCVAMVSLSPSANAAPGTGEVDCQSSTAGCGCSKDANDPEAKWECNGQTGTSCHDNCDCHIQQDGQMYCVVKPQEPIDP